MSERAQPKNIEAEKSVLGAVLMRPSTLDDISDVQVDEFFLPAHREILEAMRALAARSAPIDILAVVDELRVRGRAAMLEGGESYMLSLVNELPSLENASYYVRLVRQKATLRRLIAACAEIQSSAYGDFGEFETFMSEARQKIAAVDSPGDDGPRPIGEGMLDLLASIENRASNPAQYFITTGLSSFDERVIGFRAGNLIVIAGRPGMGKSAWALDIAINNAEAGVPGVIVSMEMNADEVKERILAKRARVNGRAVVTGRLSLEEWGRVNDAAGRIAGLPLAIYAKTPTITRLCSIIRRWFSRLPAPEEGRKKLATVVIDYLGLIKSSGEEENRALEIGAMTRALKELASELDIPIILLAQLNREGVKQGRRPIPSDLRDSGAIEQDANMIVFPFWEGTPPLTGRFPAWLIVGKNRGGPVGEFEVDWIPEFMEFADPETGPPAESRTPYRD